MTLEDGNGRNRFFNLQIEIIYVHVSFGYFTPSEPKQVKCRHLYQHWKYIIQNSLTDLFLAFLLLSYQWDLLCMASTF